MTPDERAVLRDAAAHLVVDDLDLVGLDRDSEHHLFRVLRVRDGEIVTVTDGAGGGRTCRVVDGTVRPDGEERREPAPVRPVQVAFAIPKRDRPEWIVQKLTELGVARIVLLHAERSVVRWDAERAAKHRRKLEKVIVEALQQSRGVWLPTLDGPVDAADVMADFVAAEPGGRPLTDGDGSIAIGPEGGWTADELEFAAGRVDLGSTVLRVETAALAAAAHLRLR